MHANLDHLTQLGCKTTRQYQLLVPFLTGNSMKSSQKKKTQDRLMSLHGGQNSDFKNFPLPVPTG